MRLSFINTLIPFKNFKVLSNIFNPKDIDCDKSGVLELGVENPRNRNFSHIIYTGERTHMGQALTDVIVQWEFNRSSCYVYLVEQYYPSHYIDELYSGEDYEPYIGTTSITENLDYGNSDNYNEDDFGCENI